MRGLIPVQSQQAAPDPQMGMGGLLSQAQALPAPQQQAPARERGRVNPARVLSRFIFGGEDPFQAADAERTRLQTEADMPRQRMLREQTLGAIQDPRERALFAGLGGEDWQKNVGQQFAPQVVASGAAQVVNGRRTVDQPSFTESGDTILARSANGVAPVFTRTTPSIAEQTAQTVAETGRINALNPVTVAANADLVTPDGRQVYQGYRAPEITNVAPGGEALVTDAQGNIVNRYASTSARPMSDADQTAVTKSENSIAAINTATTRANQIVQQIQSGELNLGPVTNMMSSGRNRIGQSDTNSRNFEGLMNWAKEARDAILSANNGVQTDGDAVRALDRILSSPNDEAVVTQSLQRFLESQQATAQVLQRDIARRQGGQAAGAQGGSAPVRVTTPQEAQALPPGTQFVTPDGQVRVRR